MKLAISLLRPALGALLTGIALFVAAAGPGATPAVAQGQSIQPIRDTEVERLLRSYLNPLLIAAGLRPEAVHLYVIQDPTINAFVAGGQNMFINTGLLTQLKTPNQVQGVMAHETGHMADGHLVRRAEGVRMAMVPMLLSIAAGVATMAAGAGDAGAAIIAGGQQLAQRDLMAFSRTQESSADQAGLRFLTAAGESGEGMLEVFKRFENEEVLSAEHQDPFAMDHPTSQQRIQDLEALVKASPYYGKTDTPEQMHAFDMVQAKLRGYLDPPAVVLRQYPASDHSEPARYARALAYLREPNMDMALEQMNSLLAEEPNNPYFLEMMGDIKVQMNRVSEAVEPYKKAVAILPHAPLIRISLGSAMLGTENPKYLEPARDELETALQSEEDNYFAWYELAEAYGRLGDIGKADLATAERYFYMNSYPQAMQFAYRAQKQLPRGTRDWQRANDILSVAQAQTPDRN